MKHRLVALAALVAVSLTGGCGLIESAVNGTPAPAATTATATAKPVPAGTKPTADTGFGSVKDSGDIPDVCKLLSEQEVTSLTGREITQIDEDGAEPGEPSRYCQWQQEGGQLAVFLSRTTAEDFDVMIAEASPVDGVGEDAFLLAGHLYVLYGTVQLDIYSRGASDDQNLADAKKVAKVLIPRV
ncbi:DUF3558 family protein [Paractinoplanes brasiliensis]|uniref:Uncharacterized protein DUF3558 n=1 Tax=Paractinoplanes brasiliensis TaxID=52695 RepID=A0A4R6JWW7_9ACTN|nr:DUF3558 family protein [Actinoplanes brasiliensis]TDO41283.1 uncharacterized protein DUF3558 [Actinoplanes brasiliensis]GID27434.1 hypothetical protein Abr02nite_24170 [Actinoplanes brasiliensis]